MRAWRAANKKLVAQQNLRYRQKHKAEINSKRRAKAYQESRSVVAITSTNLGGNHDTKSNDPEAHEN